MFQILNFLSENGIDLINNTFAMVGRLYGYMLDISTHTSSSNLNGYLSGIIQSFYTIAGIFMLFRLSVTAFSYIIDPDKLTDSKTGGNKLLLNIVITIFLLIAFFPNGLIVNFLQNVENVFLYSETSEDVRNGTGTGFFSNIFRNVKNNSESAPVNSKTIDILYKDFLAIDNVDAKSKKCFFKNAEGNTEGIKTQSIDISLSNDTFNKISLKQKIGTNGEDVVHYNLTSSAKGKSSCNDLAMGCKTTVKRITSTRGGAITQRKTTCDITSKNDIYKDDVSWKNKYGARWVLADDEATAEGGEAAHIYTHNLSPNEGEFANGLAGAFYSCNKDKESARDSFNKKYTKMIKSGKFNQNLFKELDDGDNSDELCYAFEIAPLYIQADGKKDGGKMIDKGELDAYFFTSVIFGIAMMIYLIVLCVEVILRNLKLILYQIIAPIPIINGIDPNDQMRKRWLKAYFGAYLDLFLKIFAIQFLARVVVLIPDLFNEKGTMFKLFFIIAILAFVKVVPNLISKVLGIEDFTGATKEVGGMLKKGLGMGAGMAVGGFVGGLTGKGLAGSTFGALRGMSRGAASGYKNDLLGGSRSIASTNKLNNDLKEQGVGWLGRTKTGLAVSAGVTSPYELRSDALDKREDAYKEKMYALKKREMEQSRVQDAASSIKTVKDTGDDLAIGKAPHKQLSEVKQWHTLNDLLTAKQNRGEALTEFERNTLDTATKLAKDAIGEFNLKSAVYGEKDENGNPITFTRKVSGDKVLNFEKDANGNYTGVFSWGDGESTIDNTVKSDVDVKALNAVASYNSAMKALDRDNAMITAENVDKFSISESKKALEHEAAKIAIDIKDAKEPLESEKQKIDDERRQLETSADKLAFEAAKKSNHS